MKNKNDAERIKELEAALESRQKEVDRLREIVLRSNEQVSRLEGYRTDLLAELGRYKRFAQRYFSGDLEV